jgi:hypothetical protein
MPSILPGFEYGIFISYRHKDNKYDGWVTEFVSNLKKSLRLPSRKMFPSILMKSQMMVYLKRTMWERVLRESLKASFLFLLLRKHTVIRKALPGSMNFVLLTSWLTKIILDAM